MQSSMSKTCCHWWSNSRGPLVYDGCEQAVPSTLPPSGMAVCVSVRVLVYKTVCAKKTAPIFFLRFAFSCFFFLKCGRLPSLDCFLCISLSSTLQHLVSSLHYEQGWWAMPTWFLQACARKAKLGRKKNQRSSDVYKCFLYISVTFNAPRLNPPFLARCLYHIVMTAFSRRGQTHSFCLWVWQQDALCCTFLLLHWDLDILRRRTV